MRSSLVHRRPEISRQLYNIYLLVAGSASRALQRRRRRHLCFGLFSLSACLYSGCECPSDDIATSTEHKKNVMGFKCLIE